MSELLASGVQLMLVGMGTVFSFLTLLVFAMLAMSKLVQRFAPAETTPAPAVPKAHVAAITAALAQHRRQQGASDE